MSRARCACRHDRSFVWPDNRRGMRWRAAADSTPKVDALTGGIAGGSGCSKGLKPTSGAERTLDMEPESPAVRVRRRVAALRLRSSFDNGRCVRPATCALRVERLCARGVAATRRRTRTPELLRLHSSCRRPGCWLQSFEHPEPPAYLLFQRVDLACCSARAPSSSRRRLSGHTNVGHAARRHPRSRHARMIDSSVSAPSLQTELHLEITAICRRLRRPLRERIVCTAARSGSCAAGCAGVRSRFLARLPYCAIDERRAPFEDQVARDPVGGGPNPPDRLERVGRDQGVISRSIRSTAFAARCSPRRAGCRRQPPPCHTTGSPARG